MADQMCSFRVLTGLSSRKRVRARFCFGFTLIELLVVIAIIAILAAILFPVFASARVAGFKVRCSSQIKQLATASLLYADDNSSRFVPGASDIFTTNLQRWHGKRANASSEFDPAKGPLWSYFAKSRGLKKCPAAPKLASLITDPSAFEAGCGGYGYNYIYVGGSYDRRPFPECTKVAAMTSEVRYPAKTVMFTDTAMPFNTDNPHLIEYSFCEPPFTVFNRQVLTMHNSPTIHFRHDGRANVVWCDGHVSAEKMSFSDTNIYRIESGSFDVGWFGPNDNSLFDLN